MQTLPLHLKHIYLEENKKNAKKQKIYTYNLTKIPEHYPLSETIMNKFQKLGLDHREKMLLNIEYRKILCRYKSINKSHLKRVGIDILENIAQKTINKTKIKIKAEGMMGYFCLAAIFSGKISTKKHIVFELSAIPLALFPKSLVKEVPPMTEVIFSLKGENWISHFKSLYKCPKYMNLKHSFVQDKKTIKFAA